MNSDGELGICSPNSASIAKGIRGLSYPLLAPSWVALGPLSQEELDWGAVFLLLDGVPGFGCVLSSLGPGIRLFSRPNLSKCETNMRWPASGRKMSSSDEYKGSGGLHGEGNGTPLQYSCLENPMDGGAWKAAVHGVAEGWTQQSGFIFTFHFHALKKEMATHSSVLAWRSPGTGEPGGLPSMGSHRVGQD